MQNIFNTTDCGRTLLTFEIVVYIFCQTFFIEHYNIIYHKYEIFVKVINVILGLVHCNACLCGTQYTAYSRTVTESKMEEAIYRSSSVRIKPV